MHATGPERLFLTAGLPSFVSFPTTTTQAKPKLRRVSKACGPCSLAHSACDRVRPCKRCVGLGKADQCVDVSTGRRRGRPRRQANDADGAEASDSPGLVATKIELDADEAPLPRPGGRERNGRQETTTTSRQRPGDSDGDSNNESSDQVEEYEEEEEEDDYDENVRPAPKRRHVETTNSSGGAGWDQQQALAQMLEQQQSLVDELRTMRKELAEVRQTQSAHEKYFALIMPMLSSSGEQQQLTRHYVSPTSSPPSPPLLSPVTGLVAGPAAAVTTASTSTTTASHHHHHRHHYHHSPSHSSSSPSPNSTNGSPSLLSSASSSPTPAERRDSARTRTEPSASTTSAAAAAAAAAASWLTGGGGGGALPTAVGGLEAWDCPPPPTGQYNHYQHHHHQTAALLPHAGQHMAHGFHASSLRQDPSGADLGTHVGLGMIDGDRGHSGVPHFRAYHLPLGRTGTGLYQKDLTIPSYAYDQQHVGFDVPLTVRLEVLRCLPFLAHYNVTSTAVPFAITDTRLPLAVCRAKPLRAPGEEIVTELVHVSSTFGNLIGTSPESVLGTSCTHFLVPGDDNVTKKFFEEMAPWVTMRSSVPCSPVLSGRLLVRSVDGSTTPARARVQMFYNEDGYFVLCVAQLTVDNLGPLPAPSHRRTWPIARKDVDFAH